MVDGWCQAGKVDEAVACFSALAGEERQPTGVTYMSLIDGFCNTGSTEGAVDIWSEMREKDMLQIEFPIQLLCMDYTNMDQIFLFIHC